MSTFQAIDDEALIRYICSAAKRIVYIAPGVHAPVAQALGKRFSEVEQLDVTVVIDPDEDVCRIGYGDIVKGAAVDLNFKKSSKRQRH